LRSREANKSDSGGGNGTKRDIAVLVRMIGIYCEGNHGDLERARFEPAGKVAEYIDSDSSALCADCTRLLLHGAAKRMLCPYDPKPRCRDCPKPCYGREYRKQIREVMRFSGMRMLKTGRIDLVLKHLL